VKQMKKAKKKIAAKTRAKREPEAQKEPPLKRHTVHSLPLTKFELLHLRDLMSVLLPPDGVQTLSQALAGLEERSLIESMLWEKISKLCSEAKLPLDAEAPDYIIAPVAPPPLGVFQVNQDLSSKSQSEGGFLKADESDEAEEVEEE